MSIEDLWYRNAIIYCLDVEKFMDSTGDGVGDFQGLSERLPYLAGLGVTCVWLLPFSESPNRDNGYDVTDYYSVHDKYGSLGDFVAFTNHARALGIHVVVDLVVNHTSIDHPWFQHARKDPKSPFRDWYVWSKHRPANHHTGMVFPGVQKTTWTYDDEAQQYYFHRFYEHQADLNTSNQVLALRYVWRNTAFLTLHNFADTPQTVHVDVGTNDADVVCDYFDEDHSRAADSGKHEIELDPFMHKWYRVGGPDTTTGRASGRCRG